MNHILVDLLVLMMAFAGGLVGAISGGGGIVLLPALLLAGLPAPLLVGTNKLLSVFTTLPSAIVYFRKLKIDLQYWYIAIFFTAFGAIVSVLVVRNLPPDLLKYILAVLLFSSSLYTFFKPKHAKPSAAIVAKPASPILKNSCCFGISCFSGILGAGAGMLWTSALMGIFKLDLLHASGVARLLSFVSNMVAFGFYAKFGLIDFNFGIQIGVVVVLGAYVGAHTAMAIDEKYMKWALLILAIVTSIALIL